MRYLSLFSGIEAASVAWIPLGWECVGVAEIEQFPCKVLGHHYPSVPNLGDITNITKEQVESLGHIDLVVGGFPCQDLSVAGLRKGLKNEDGSATRSGLFYTAMRIARWAKPRWILLENVPGLYSSHKGDDFAAVVREMGGSSVSPTVPSAGWGTEGVALGEKALVEWATLDAQWFGVAQRRRRCFALADFGDWTSRPPILLEPESVRGDTPPSREKGQEVTEIAGTLAANGGGTTRPAGNANELDFCVATWPADIASTLNASFGSKLGLENQHINAGAPLFVPTYALAGNTIGRQPENGGNGAGYSEDLSYTLTKTDQHAVAYGFDKECNGSEELIGTMTANMWKEPPSVAFGQMQVRRLTPLECHRLQGFPDHFLHQVKGATDSAMYKALGNSMAVPVMRWIGQRMKDAITAQELLTNPLP